MSSSSRYKEGVARRAAARPSEWDELRSELDCNPEELRTWRITVLEGEYYESSGHHALKKAFEVIFEPKDETAVRTMYTSLAAGKPLSLLFVSMRAIEESNCEHVGVVRTASEFQPKGAGWSPVIKFKKPELGDKFWVERLILVELDGEPVDLIKLKPSGLKSNIASSNSTAPAKVMSTTTKPAG